MRFIQTKDYESLSKTAADILAAQVLLKPHCVLGLATGSSPEGLYQNLIEQYHQGKLDFSTVHTVNLDEYVGLPADHDQSYAYFMQDKLFSHINIPAQNTFLPNGLSDDIAAEGIRYDNLISKLGGIDMQLLGIGANGHIGFNEPDTHFPCGTHLVTLTEKTRQDNSRFFESIDLVPTHAVTMGIGTIMGAKRILLIASGENKAQIVKDAFFGPVTPQVPASILQLHPDVTIIADEKACTLL